MDALGAWDIMIVGAELLVWESATASPRSCSGSVEECTFIGFIIRFLFSSHTHSSNIVSFFSTKEKEGLVVGKPHRVS